MPVTLSDNYGCSYPSRSYGGKINYVHTHVERLKFRLHKVLKFWRKVNDNLLCLYVQRWTDVG